MLSAGMMTACLILALFLTLACPSTSALSVTSLTAKPASAIPISRVLSFVARQYSTVYRQWLEDPTNYPNYGVPSDTKWQTLSSTRATFTNGFFPGRFFYLYDYSGNKTQLERGINTTWPLANVANMTTTHDVGFVIMSSFGHLYRLQPSHRTLAVISQAARSLATRYSATVHCTRSWDAPLGFEVIIDNMMNLELLWVAGLTNQTYTTMAFNHANRTMYEHVRPDGSTYHVVNYTASTGAVYNKFTAQGFADWSTWSRGQAWCVYGFTMAYRYTGHQPFLQTAVRAANYFEAHLNETVDSVPYWDFLSPFNTSYQPRDTSAGAIFASALTELSQYVSAAQRSSYYATVERVLTGLVGERSEYYVANGVGGVRLPAVLVNATTGPWHGFGSSAPYNVGESYADYYLTEALVRLSALSEGKPLPILRPESVKRAVIDTNRKRKAL